MVIEFFRSNYSHMKVWVHCISRKFHPVYMYIFFWILYVEFLSFSTSYQTCFINEGAFFWLVVCECLFFGLRSLVKIRLFLLSMFLHLLKVPLRFRSMHIPSFFMPCTAISNHCPLDYITHITPDPNISVCNFLQPLVKVPVVCDQVRFCLHPSIVFLHARFIAD